MRKLTGLLAFAVALAIAVVVTKYYSTPTQPKESQQPVPGLDGVPADRMESIPHDQPVRISG